VVTGLPAGFNTWSLTMSKRSKELRKCQDLGVNKDERRKGVDKAFVALGFFHNMYTSCLYKVKQLPGDKVLDVCSLRFPLAETALFMNNKVWKARSSERLGSTALF